MPVPSAPQPSSRVCLFIEGVRHNAIEFSPAGVTLARTSVEAQELDALRRGTPCSATLQVYGEMYGVVLRLAAQGPLHIEFAFVSLAPQARRALEHYAAQVPEPEDPASAGAELPVPMALAFARLASSIVPQGRRMILPESETVYALTVDRRGAPEPVVEPSSAPSRTVTASDPDVITLAGRELLAYGIALLAILSLMLMWMLG